jgi:hypothetical protein
VLQRLLERRRFGVFKKRKISLQVSEVIGFFVIVEMISVVVYFRQNGLQRPIDDKANIAKHFGQRHSLGGIWIQPIFIIPAYFHVCNIIAAHNLLQANASENRRDSSHHLEFNS